MPTEKLLAAIERNPSLWKQITERQDTPGSPHRDTESIFLRGPSENSVHAMFNETFAVNYPALKDLPEAHYLIHRIADAVNGREIGRIILAKLKPGGAIMPHLDEGAYADHFERFHLVLATNADCWFQCDHDEDSAEFVRMKEKELWWFNHKKVHTAFNNGRTPRTHLIIDLVAPSFKERRLKQ